MQASFALGLFFFLLSALPAFTQPVSSAYVGRDGKAHIVFLKHSQTIAPEDQQVGCEGITVARDRHSVAWSILVPNCCTSYPIPTAVVVQSDGRKTVIHPDGLMVHSWHFVGRGERIAILFGPVHGEAAGARLYDSRTGKTLALWDTKGVPPDWAKGLKPEE